MFKRNERNKSRVDTRETEGESRGVDDLNGNERLETGVASGRTFNIHHLGLFVCVYTYEVATLAINHFIQFVLLFYIGRVIRQFDFGVFFCEG